MPPSQLLSIEVEFSCGDTDVFVEIKPKDQKSRRPCNFLLGNPKNNSSILKKTNLSTLQCDFEFDAFEKLPEFRIYSGNASLVKYFCLQNVIVTTKNKIEFNRNYGGMYTHKRGFQHLFPSVECPEYGCPNGDLNYLNTADSEYFCEIK